MSSINAKVSFKPLYNCLVSLPAPFISPFINSASLLIQNVVVRLIPINAKHTKQSIYCGWTGFFSSDSSTIEIDPSFASINGIDEHTELQVQLVLSTDISQIQSAELEPITPDDWEMIELNARTIEDTFLNQVRALQVNQTIGIHPNCNASSSIIRLKVVNIHSTKDEIHYGLLTNNTELHIAPNVRKATTSPAKASKDIGNSNKPTNATIKKPRVFRSVPILDSSKYQDYCLLADLDSSQGYVSGGRAEYVEVSVVEGPGTPARAKRPTKDASVDANFVGSNRNGVTVVIARIINTPNVGKNTAVLSNLLSIALGLEQTVGEKVMISPLTSDRISDSHVKLIIHPIITETPKISLNEKKMLQNRSEKRINEHRKKKHLQIMLKKNLQHLYSSKSVPITNGLKLPRVTGTSILKEGGIIEIASKNQQSISWALCDIGNVSVEKGTDILKGRSFVQQLPKKNKYDNDFVAREKEFAAVSHCVARRTPVVVYGASGSGKTHLCHKISAIFRAKEFYVKRIDCNELVTNTSPENMNKLLLGTLIQDLIWHQPSLLILENVDALIPKASQQQQNSSNSYLAEILCSRYTNLRNSRKVSILMSCKNRDSVNPLIFQKHLIEEEISLKAPNKQQRFLLLSHFLAKYPKYAPEDTEFLQDIASETEGYLPADVKSICDRAFHNLIASSISLDDIKFGASNFVSPLKDYTPASLRGVKLQKGTGTSWKDIGGLKDAKNTLLETFEWPTKYAPIFAKCPLRLRSGILLYGYPGCGKTLLASAVASQCGLNFISVKGPEILNKYIGASEQSVRELFDRATAAKPCVLFFDEFDSIAPKRGHDSTGVTDRIVNQLLTQMDGAEGLDGVYVLAATSRPDLIDSALLRPGRLDKSVLCDMPDYENCLDILTMILRSNKFHLADDVDLKSIAKKCTGFSGADIQALAYNSYLKAVHEDLDKQLQAEGNSGDTELEYSVTKLEKTTDLTRQDYLSIASEMKNLRQHLVETKLDDRRTPNNDNSGTSVAKKIIVIHQKHFKQGLKETNKSISNKELMKFHDIYSNFNENKREGGMPDGEASQGVGKRVTLM